MNPLIDTVHPRWFYFASAARPFGLVALSPDTNTETDWNGGYRYGDTRIQCLSHLHEWQIGGIPIMPIGPSGSENDYSSEFDRGREVVRPGFHRLYLTTADVEVELTSTCRVGFHRYTFPSGIPARIVIDLARPFMESSVSESQVWLDADQCGLSGSFVLGPTIRRAKPIRICFAIRFSQPMLRISEATEGKFLLDFRVLADPLLIKVAPSFTNIEGAKRNLQAELPHWDFDRIVEESDAEWNDWLGRIEVEGGTPEATTKFYTDLWHSLLGRRILNDFDGSYPDNTGDSLVIRQAPDGLPHHNFDAFWGAQWSINLLWPLAWPRVVEGFAATMLRMYRDGGLIPRGPSGGDYTFVMVGDPAASFFANAFFKGIRGWDAQEAYAGLRKNAFPGGIRSHAGYERGDSPCGGGIAFYCDRGYIPQGIPGAGGFHQQGVSQTLEYAYQDYALALLARELGHAEDAEVFSARAKNYRNMWDTSVGWMRARNLDGSWVEPFAPLGEGATVTGFVEASAAIGTFFVPHDLEGLAELFGGPEAAVDRLEEMFQRAEPQEFVVPHGHHGEAWIDYENQPSTGLAHYFAHWGRPDRTQYWVRRVHDVVYSDITPFGGYRGDEDQGQMGAVSALMAMGIFAADGGVSPDPHYQITMPKFRRITIHLDPEYATGRAFTIEVEGDPMQVYIESATLNGKPLPDLRFPHSALMEGGTLVIRPRV